MNKDELIQMLVNSLNAVLHMSAGEDIGHHADHIQKSLDQAASAGYVPRDDDDDEEEDHRELAWHLPE